MHFFSRTKVFSSLYRMEGANGSWWSLKESSNIFPPSFNAVDLPITSVTSAEAVSNQIPKTTDSNLISPFYGPTGDAAAQKAYGEPYGNHQTLNYASTEQESSQGQDSAKHHDPEINDKTLNYPLALSSGYECPNTAGSNSEANGDHHQTFTFIQEQPAGYDCPNKADTSLGINADNHQTFNYLSPDVGTEKASSNRKRKSPEDTGDRRSKKLIYDKAYRDRCKEVKEKTMADNDRLNTEICRLKEERVEKERILLNQEREIKKLQQNVKRLEKNLGIQTSLVEHFLKHLASENNIHLQNEITCLKGEIDRLLASINSPSDSIIHQFQERNAQLQREKSMLRMIVEDLFKKINKSKDPLQD